MDSLTTENDATNSDLLEQLSSLTEKKHSPEVNIDDEQLSDISIIAPNEDNIDNPSGNENDDANILAASSPISTASSPIMLSESEEENNSSDTDEEDEFDMLKKLENNSYEDILLRYHPEVKQNNYNEILAMSKTVRNSDGIISDALHRTLPWLTKYERSKILGLRSKQLSYGAEAFIEVSSGIMSGYKIAVEELNQKKIPFIIRRPLPNGGNEYWKLEDLELLNSY